MEANNVIEPRIECLDSRSLSGRFMPQRYSVGNLHSRKKRGAMRFVLTYRGLLPPSGDPQDKHAIRRQLHPQLKRQWEVEPALDRWRIVSEEWYKQENAKAEIWTPVAVEFTRGPFRFLPLVVKHLHLVCTLDITMLRPEEPGKILQHGGDIDNRMKTLFDSLRMPANDSEVAGFAPASDESPFYCLLEDDCLVTSLQVKTERLLRPLDNPKESRVELLIAVNVRPTRLTRASFKVLEGWLP